MALPKEMFVIDDQLKSDIRENPFYRDLARGFECVENKETKDSKHLQIQVKSEGRVVPLKDYNKMGHLVQSECYLNRYYPLFEYAKIAYEDLAGLMNLLCNFMGDNVKFECEIYEESLTNSQSSHSQNTSGGGNYKAFEANAEYNSSNSQETNNQNGRWIKFSANVSNAKKTPEELKNYIEQNYINLHALPASFRVLVETYLQSENAKFKSYERQEHTLEQASKCTKKCQSFTANASLLPIFKAEFGWDLSDETNSSRKVLTKIRHCVNFE